MTKKLAKKKPPLKVKNIKFGAETLKLIEQRAKKFTDGNLSAFLRYTALRYTPKKGEPVPFKTVL